MLTSSIDVHSAEDLDHFPAEVVGDLKPLLGVYLVHVGVEQIILKLDLLDQHFCVEYIRLVHIDVNGVVLRQSVRIYVILDRSYLMIHEIFLSGDVPREAPDAVIYRDDIRVEAADEVVKRVQRRYLASCCDVDVNAERGNSLVRVILREGVHRDMTFVKMCVNGIRLDTVPVKEAGALVAGAVNMFGVNMSLRKENIDRGPLRIIILL